jgi:hypothetical protein
MSARTLRINRLRPYQREVCDAILASIEQRRGDSFSVEIARQGGKNELSAFVELQVLFQNLDRSITSIKLAPTARPQVRISMERLWHRVRDLGLEAYAAQEGGNSIRLGRARQLFLSADKQSNVVGHTADLLLEIDEAQDVDVDKFDKELQPMAAANGATTVFYGTAWDDANLLDRSKQRHLELERRDGRRRHFEYDWRVIAAHNPPYERFVAAQEERLGADHPLFASQFLLKTLPGTGRLLSADQLSLLNGSHSRLEAAVPGDTCVAGLDVAGEAIAGRESAHDVTVLTVARVRPPDVSSPVQAPSVEVVRHYAWQGAPHAEQYGAVVSLLRETWRVSRVAVDATGIGEPLAAFLSNALGSSRVEAVKLSADSKSTLGYELLTAVSAGRVRLYGGSEAAECRRQIEHCRAVYKPNRTLSFFVDQRDGHDDYVISLALCVSAAATGGPRTARGRREDGF